MMTVPEAVGFIASICMRIFGLLIIIAENLPYSYTFNMDSEAVEFIDRQRQWYNEQQDMLNAMKMVDELLED